MGAFVCSAGEWFQIADRFVCACWWEVFDVTCLFWGVGSTTQELSLLLYITHYTHANPSAPALNMFARHVRLDLPRSAEL